MSAGLIFAPFVINELKRNRRSMHFFVAAVIFTVTAVITDSFDLHPFSYGFQKFLQYVEEVSETVAQICFINSFFCVTVEKVSQPSGKNKIT